MDHVVTLEIRKQIGTYRVVEKEDGVLGPVYRRCYDPVRGRRYETLCGANGQTAFIVREAVKKRIAA